MKEKIVKNKKLTLNRLNKAIYFEKSGIVVDDFCPNCKNIVFNNKDFCVCGFFLKASRNNIFWTAISSSFLIFVFIFALVTINFQVQKNKIVEKLHLQNTNFNSISPVNIQILSSLRNTAYYRYIQDVYVKKGDESNLVILVRPCMWNDLKENEKKEILNIVAKKWLKIYVNKSSTPGELAHASFANRE